MILRDRVNILKAGTEEDEYHNVYPTWDAPTLLATVRAEVSYVTVGTYNAEGRQAFIEELRAIIEPFPFDPATQRLQWRGQQYETDGPARTRRRNGQDHHLTIPIKLVTG